VLRVNREQLVKPAKEDKRVKKEWLVLLALQVSKEQLVKMARKV
jgi:hypothetical protein